MAYYSPLPPAQMELRAQAVLQASPPPDSA